MANINYYTPFLEKIEEFKSTIELVEQENISNKKDVLKILNQTLQKIDAKENLNDNDRYIILNLTNLFKDHYIRDYIVDQNVMILTNSDSENFAFTHNNKKYIKNSNINPSNDLIEALQPIIRKGFNSEYYHFKEFCKSNFDLSGMDFNYTKPSDLHDKIFSYYYSGGFSGRNCWDDHPGQEYEECKPDDYNKFEFLTTILKTYKLDITTSELESLKESFDSKFYEEEFEGDHDYYDNYSTYQADIIDMKDAFDVLKMHQINLNPKIKNDKKKQLKNKIK